MKLSEAPPSGWYPDPEGRARLRWWDGGDWSDRYRARPPEAWSSGAPTQPAVTQHSGQAGAAISQASNEAEAIVAQVQIAAREEAQRAADLFSQRAREATGLIPPLISQYTSRIQRWFKLAVTLTLVILAGWLAFQIFAQKSMFDWLGDRIDNITDNSGSLVSLAATWITRT